MVRYVLGVVLGVGVLLRCSASGPTSSPPGISSPRRPGWVAAAVLAEALSLWTFAPSASGAAPERRAFPMPALFLLTLANDAIANTVPGDPAVSSAYRYRYYRRCEATGASAGWTIFTILIAQAIGMSLLLLLGVLLALASSTSEQNAGGAVVGLVIVLVAGAILVRRDLVLRLAGARVRGMRRVTGHPRATSAPGSSPLSRGCGKSR